MEGYKRTVNAVEFSRECSTTDCHNPAIGRSFAGMLGSIQMWRYYCGDHK